MDAKQIDDVLSEYKCIHHIRNAKIDYRGSCINIDNIKDNDIALVIDGYWEFIGIFRNNILMGLDLCHAPFDKIISRMLYTINKEIGIDNQLKRKINYFEDVLLTLNKPINKQEIISL